MASSPEAIFAHGSQRLCEVELLGASAAGLPSIGKAGGAATYDNVVFTAENSGHWEYFATLHVPLVEVLGRKLVISTPHPQSAEHHIISHLVVLAGGVFLSRKPFTYKQKPVSEHLLPAGYSGPATITSTCLWHDFWVKVITV